MSATNDFIAELVGAANRLDGLDDTAKSRLLERAITVIRDRRDHLGISSGTAEAEGLIAIRAAAVAMTEGRPSDDEIRTAFLKAAGMIRDLNIMVDPETDVEARKPDGGDPGNY